MRSPRFANAFRVDGRGNVLFPHHDPADPERVVGYEVKNRGYSGFAAGGRKTYWSSASRADDERLVIVEGAIDALSYHQLFPSHRTCYLSTGGGVGPEHLALIGHVIAAMPTGAEIIGATDNDIAGETLHMRLVAAAGVRPLRRHPSPVLKDWNDCLRAALQRGRPLGRERRLER
jgi:hypothetical protein